MKTRWKFLREGMKSENGDCRWKKNEWKHYDGELSMCNSGFHCSKKIKDAFSYIQGEVLVKVQVKGKSVVQNDKEVWSDMRVVKAWKWEKKDSIALTIFSAKLCLSNFETEYPEDKRPRLAIEAAKKYLDNPTEENRSAVQSAESAAESAESAARSAASARSAARSAAWSAAWSARSARSAARSAAVKKISTWMDEHVKKLEETT